MLRSREFLREWKVAKELFLPNGDWEEGGQSACIRLCLLNTLSNLYVLLIREILDEEIKMKGGLNQNQYGFRKSRSTVMAVKELVKTTRECGMR